jgi:hypothetical protein
VIEGKVAAILNARELVINRGSKHGVQEGMTFAVLDNTGASIKDPDTNEEIGSVLRDKIRVKIVQVKDSLSVGRTYEVTRGRGGLFGSASIADMLAYEPPHPRTLSTDEAVFPPLNESQSYVKRGDIVRQVVDD